MLTSNLLQYDLILNFGYQYS